MLIRVEIPVDKEGIDHLLRQSFPGAFEADLVKKLREEGLITLGLVATDDETGKIIGYVAFTPVDIEGQACQWVGLAPVAVLPDHQREGIGKKLIYAGLDSLNEFGYQGVVVLGDPKYYGKLGFKPARDYQLTCKWEEAQWAFQVYVLENEIALLPRGRVDFSSHFDGESH